LYSPVNVYGVHQTHLQQSELEVKVMGINILGLLPPDVEAPRQTSLNGMPCFNEHISIDMLEYRLSKLMNGRP